MAPTPSHDTQAEPGYETRDAHIRPILLAGLALVAAVVLVGLFLRWMLGALKGNGLNGSPPRLRGKEKTR